MGGDHGSCVVCHGGNPAATTKKEAHRGAPEDLDAETFYPDPGSIWIADKTCGVSGCHEGYVYRLMRRFREMNGPGASIPWIAHPGTVTMPWMTRTVLRPRSEVRVTSNT
jgi:hypothetical protein